MRYPVVAAASTVQLGLAQWQHPPWNGHPPDRWHYTTRPGSDPLPAPYRKRSEGWKAKGMEGDICKLADG